MLDPAVLPAELLGGGGTERLQGAELSLVSCYVTEIGWWTEDRRMLDGCECTLVNLKPFHFLPAASLVCVHR